jgi:hypothetical protein
LNVATPTPTPTPTPVPAALVAQIDAIAVLANQLVTDNTTQITALQQNFSSPASNAARAKMVADLDTMVTDSAALKAAVVPEA